MSKRYAAIWLPYLLPDWWARQHPETGNTPFVLTAPAKGKTVVKAASPLAREKGIWPGMVLADCKTIFPELHAYDWPPEKECRLLKALGEWCIRFSPVVSVDAPGGLLIDMTGCAHLWGGEVLYRQEIIKKLGMLGYQAQVAIAGTPGVARAIARFGENQMIISSGLEKQALLPLPPAALTIDNILQERLYKLGMQTIGSFINMPGSALRRRFGNDFLQKLQQALGLIPELISPIEPATPYFQHLPCPEPVRTANAIEIALQQLLQQLCNRLKKEEAGLRICTFNIHRTDGQQQQLRISTGKPSSNPDHLMKLFEHKIATISPGPGIDLFTMEARQVMPLTASQDAFWGNTIMQDDIKLAELLDRVADRVGHQNIKRYLPDEHYWPERSIKVVTASQDIAPSEWPEGLPRPIHLLARPILIEATVPLPDYPPISFKLKGELYKVVKADGPERIEQEWWLQQGQFRDYYCVENEQGSRYWIFRSGHYQQQSRQWFIHGFFA